MRKICVAVHSRANYARIKSLLRAIQNHPQLQLQLVVGASALLYRYGNVIDIIKKDGFTPDVTCHMVLEGSTPASMAKSTGVGIIELSSAFERLSPDVVVTVADRYETLSSAVAASYMNIPLAHTQGGEVTGSIDESVRHAITKLAHIHFPASELAAQNVIRLGENPEKVFFTGCPAMDLLDGLDLRLSADFFERHGGVGHTIRSEKEYVVVLQHPVTTEYETQEEQISETLSAVEALDMQAVWLWPNVDAGTDGISKILRSYREKNPQSPIHFYKNFPPLDYAQLIYNSRCLVGNSSSAIREGSFLGVPAVNIGNRQKGRQCGDNVISVPPERSKILDAINQQLAHGKYEPNPIYGNGNAGKRMADILATVDLDINKTLFYKES